MYLNKIGKLKIRVFFVWARRYADYLKGNAEITSLSYTVSCYFFYVYGIRNIFCTAIEQRLYMIPANYEAPL